MTVPWCKTSDVMKIFKANFSIENKFVNQGVRLQNLLGKGFLLKATSRTAEADGTKIITHYDKVSNWYKISLSGIIELVEIYNTKILRESDFALLAKHLLDKQ